MLKIFILVLSLSAALAVYIEGTVVSIAHETYADGTHNEIVEIQLADGSTTTVDGPDSHDLNNPFNHIDIGDFIVVDAQQRDQHSKAARTDKGRMRRNDPKVTAIVTHSKNPASEDDPDSGRKFVPKGAVRLLSIRVAYTDANEDSTCSAACVTSNLWTGSRSVDGLYREASRGSVSIPQASGAVYSVKVSKSVSSFNCNDLGTIATDAKAALAKQYPSVNTANYDLINYVTPGICGIGVAYVGGTASYVDTAYPDAFAHEIGHNFRMNHAGIDPGDDGTIDDGYGDQSCIMGYSGVSLRSFNVIHRLESGWIPSSNVKTLTFSCNYPSLAVNSLVSTGSSGYVVAKMSRPAGGYYYFSYRTSSGYDTLLKSTYLGRLQVHYQVSTFGNTALIASLGSGGVYKTRSFTVTVKSLSATTAAFALSC